MKLKEKNQTVCQVAEVKLVYKTKVKPCDRLQVRSSRHMAEVFRSVWDMENIELREESKVMYLNRVNRILGIYPLSVGGVSGTVIDIKLVLIAALRLNATFISICHNHPSGSTRASRMDELATQKLQTAARQLDIDLMDHIILTKDDYFSMADEGLI
ncbi:MAG TPA: JAB domain-containing protein [Niabella sp.]|nr:JAB domain-containing protein [Niabella sp.]